MPWQLPFYKYYLSNRRMFWQENIIPMKELYYCMQKPYDDKKKVFVLICKIILQNQKKIIDLREHACCINC